MTGDEPRPHWLELRPIRGPAGTSQWYVTCRCGWTSVEILLHLAESAARAHMRANPPHPQPAP